MRTIRITKTIHAPINEVFDAFTDHAALAQVPGIRSARVTTPGISEPNGVGAVREIDTGVIWLREKITTFDRPHRMEYRIIASRPSADHRLGRVDFAETQQGTEITWTSMFTLPFPVVGKVAEPAFGIGFGVAFRVVLHSVAKRVYSSS
jgi:uncharacterized protein YndB with AHSA1/START domain